MQLVDAIHTDFQKATDKVNRSLFILNVKYFGFERNFLNYLYILYFIIGTQIPFHDLTEYSVTSLRFQKGLI